MNSIGIKSVQQKYIHVPKLSEATTTNPFEGEKPKRSVSPDFAADLNYCYILLRNGFCVHSAGRSHSWEFSGSSQSRGCMSESVSHLGEHSFVRRSSIRFKTHAEKMLFGLGTCELPWSQAARIEKSAFALRAHRKRRSAKTCAQDRSKQLHRQNLSKPHHHQALRAARTNKKTCWPRSCRVQIALQRLLHALSMEDPTLGNLV